MKEFEALEKIISRGDFTKRDMKKIESLIYEDIKREIQRQLDDFLIDRLFIQLNAE